MSFGQESKKLTNTLYFLKRDLQKKFLNIDFFKTKIWEKKMTSPLN